jgi:hypothetical protein
MLEEPSDDLLPAHAGHGEIEQHDVVPIPGQRDHCLDSVRCFEGHMSSTLDHAHHDGAHVLGVVNNEEAQLSVHVATAPGREGNASTLLALMTRVLRRMPRALAQGRSAAVVFTRTDRLPRGG